MRFGTGCFLLAAALTMTGCGGSGSGTVNNTPPPTAPTVTSTSPSSGATAVAVNSPVTATFSEAMSASTLTTSTFTLSAQGGGAVAGTVSYSGTTAAFTPSANLAYNTQYTATITTGATASNGAAPGSNFTWSFTTAAGPAPTVVSVSPANGSANIAIDTNVTATFSEAMNAASMTSASFTLAPQGGAAVTAAVTLDASGLDATLTPATGLAYGTTYTATITTAAAAATGGTVASAYSWTFTTAAAPVAPTVATVSPASGAANVATNSAVTATFSEAMNASTLTASTFTLTPAGGSAISGSVVYSAGNMTATFAPSASLAYDKTYTATITTGAKASNGVALAANFTWTFTTASLPVTVDFGTTYQTIRGFGGSTAWLGKMPQAVATALFSPTNGLGLSILRVRIDPQGLSSGGGAHGYPYETSQWDQEAANGLEAVTANPNAVVFASPWTPPAAWKLNGSSSVQDDGVTWNQSFNTCSEGTGYCGGYLDPNHYADYAKYLEGFVQFFNTTNGFNLYAISMQNEPEENVTYESCVWTPEQMDTWIAGNASTITSDAYSTKLIMPESNSFNPVDATTALNDPNAEGLIDIVGGHIYQVLFNGSIAPYSIPAGDTQKELWMTEFGPLSTATPTFSEALTTYAESIHNSLVTGQYNAYVWWGIFGAPTNAGSYGLVDNSGNPTVFGYVVGQYSKFIQPGYVRVNATANPTANVSISAYSGNGHYAIVAINAGSAAPSLTFTLQNASGITSVKPYQTTASAGLAPQTAVNVTNGQFTYTLPAQSITTFVY